MDEKSKNRKQLLQKELKRIVSVLKKEYKPEKIILFGSLVNGNVKEWSDIDLLLIKKTKKRYLDRIDEVLNLIHPKVGVDMFVFSPQEIEKKNPYIDEILLTGKNVYEKNG